MDYALVFPGQGSQAVGMLRELAAEVPVVAQTLDQAGTALGWDIGTLIADGPEAELNRTERTQPALLAAGVAVWRAWSRSVAAPPVAMAGHSLGEYTALVAAGAVDFADALRLVELRGRYMREAAESAGGGSGMAAVIGLDDAAIESLCAACPAPGWLSAANYNAPGQVVVAGDAAGLNWLQEHYRAHGARKVVALAMSVPSHCPIMRAAAERLAPELSALAMRLPSVAVVHNLDGMPRQSVAEIRTALTEQLYKPVRWTACVRAMHELGAGVFCECGPGRVLTGVGRRILAGASWLQLDAPQALDQAISAVASTGD